MTDPRWARVLASPVVRLDWETAVHQEMACLWNDLAEARDRAINHVWSMECDGLVDRIITLCRLVDPTKWGDIPVTLLIDGTWQAIMRDFGFHVEHPPPGLVEEMREDRRRRAEVVAEQIERLRGHNAKH